LPGLLISFHIDFTPVLSSKYLLGGALRWRLGMLAVAKALLHHSQVSFHLLPRRTVGDDCFNSRTTFSAVKSF